MKTLSILGSTGSIGVSTLEVVEQNFSSLRISGLAGGRNVDRLKGQIERFRPAVAAVMDEAHAVQLKNSLGPADRTAIRWGAEGYREVATLRETDMVVSAMVGAAGLVPTLDAIEAGKDVALANKETMVMAGRIVTEKARDRGVRVLPVDSEHSAIFQCLRGHRRDEVRRIILTASGGPFLRSPLEQLAAVTVADALRHPNWVMGKKITIDSATMMNKGLEVIEARWLFDADIEKIEVVIHPQSIIHSMVEYSDGSVIAQLGVPDMKGPISYALFHPGRCPGGLARLNLLKVRALEFLPPDVERFPCLRLAFEAGKRGETMPAVMNAANEVAVNAFLEEQIGFTDIPNVIGQTMTLHRVREILSLADVMEADRWARKTGEDVIKKVKEKS
ncbi:MAG TPA: 1-deoxy-D-xylulose-5-phosphate reductoisomerase [Syntrophales bacterium]|nr:1-deoxy-D-xylulose-5-phosphate reductoisomerase [Syntrophales bacterium]HOX95195.1 1-deoxy-D-xylulose-5-phosphate reductoisomerase [Syntrophales bacterium]HPI55877.1 1-deoxy-D-xylulose-5-phosphate reductoisomerase [Syntrophales bacterium]HPN23632.1 1-deoxy-D-xylulose-5-phosphate reductoisomerase [Syntrophales bacterium]HQM27843.1 1-deoxy-D-xylulose-5-phosphate reductoisomerase [Syntrophales bacterium]